jgi:hypothetical protein
MDFSFALRLEAGTEKTRDQAENSCSQQDLSFGWMILYHEINKTTKHQNQGQRGDSKRNGSINKFSMKLTITCLKHEGWQCRIDCLVLLELFRTWNKRNLLFGHLYPGLPLEGLILMGLCL